MVLLSSSESSESSAEVVVVVRSEDGVRRGLRVVVSDRSGVVVVGRAVVGTATCQVGEGGTMTIVDVGVVSTELRLSDFRAGGRTVWLVSSNAPPRAPMVKPTATATPALATAADAMTLSRMHRP